MYNNSMNKLNLPEDVLKIFKQFKSANYEIYVVGGAVRDLLMGKPVYDWDFTTNATPKQILKIIPEGFYDNVFGTVGIKYETQEKPFEITTFRTEETYSDNRRPDKVSWGKTLKEDLKRRDLTINAMALDINKKIIDPYKGRVDLEKKLLKAVGDPSERFSEDALRMMRAIRIASELGFSIEEKTLLAISKNAPLIQKIAKERIKSELFKILSSPNPYKGIVLFKESKLMDQILPELVKCFGVEQKSPQRHHKHDVGTHLFMSLKECKSEKAVVRFAALIHDIGKPQTYKKLDSGVITFYNHEMVSTRIAKNISTRLKLSKKEHEKLITLVRYHQFTVDDKQTDKSIRRFIRRVGLEHIEDMLDLRVADRLGGGARETSWRTEDFKKRIIEVQKEPFSIKDLKIGGKEIIEELKLKPGPKIGGVLKKLFFEVTENQLPNEKEVLLEKLKEINNE